MAHNPTGYERAVGVMEAKRQCLAEGCGRQFRSANQHDTACPYCGTDDTKVVKDDASANSEKPQ